MRIEKNSLTKNLIRSNKFGEYNKIIQEQISKGITEKINETAITEKGKEFYFPYRPVIPESAEITKIRNIYDDLTKQNKHSVSLNGCLETGPPLQISLWDMLIRSRFRSILLRGDTGKAFLQIRYKNLKEMC